MISYLIKNLKNQIFSLTLHEFLAICQRDGQMVKNNTNELCYEGNAKNCKKCFPTFAEYMFEGKFEVAKSSLSEFDILTSPSNFLAKRFINTKFSDKIEVISNGLKYKDEIFACDENFIERKFAYFGQLTPYKGIALFIDAILIFEEKFNNFAQFSIYGMREEQFYNSDIGKKYKERIKNSNPSLNFFGSYEPENVISLMREHGTVVVPSIWWENSPLVIQEAFQASRPVITANIGGMLESVRDRIDGLHFEHGNSFSLFEKMLNIAFDREMWKHLRENIRKPNSIQEMNKNFINQYRIAQKRKYMFSSGSIPKS